MNYERIYRELVEMARARETVEGQVGSKFFNDGSRNFVIRQGEQVPAHLQKGKLPPRPQQK
jgi:hypothetical protein